MLNNIAALSFGNYPVVPTIPAGRLTHEEISNEVWNVTVYPNPFSGDELSLGVPNESEWLDVNIYALTGTLIFTTRAQAENGVAKLQPALSNGIYVIDIIDQEGNHSTQKLIIQQH